MKTRLTAEQQKEWGDNNPMSMDELRKFVDSAAGVPGDAIPTPITRDIGSQRDPHHIVIGFRVTWEEDR